MSAKWTCSVEELVKATKGELLSSTHSEFSKVGTDTRHSLEGMLFIPLKGANFNAHDFVSKAIEQKAKAVLVHEWREEWKPLLAKASFIKVPDTLTALQNFATAWRKKHGFKVIGITGSNGKTTTKEFTYAILKDAVSTYANKGSFNNHWGLPLSILSAGPEHKVLILEMGMNKAGELWRLSQIADPDVVVVTNVGRAHIGELGSQQKIAEAKEEVYLACPRAVHVFNMDNEWTMRMQARSEAKQQILFSSFKTEVDVNLRAQRLIWDALDILGHIRKTEGHAVVPIIGRQNNINIMCACALALAAGLEPAAIWKNMENIRDSAWGRNQIVPLQNGARVLFDAYNANPDSMTALLKNLYEMEMPGKKFLVIGDMRELGEFTESAHEEIGERASSVGFSGVWYLGENFKAFARGLEKSGKAEFLVHSAGFDPAISESFFQKINSGDVVAVKASRGLELEKVVESWPLQTPLGKKP